jgi:hypothetical protein
MPWVFNTQRLAHWFVVATMPISKRMLLAWKARLFKND